VSAGPGNWDAAWVFVKFRKGIGPWEHANLLNTGQVAPPGSAVNIGLINPAATYNSVSNYGIGAFVYRSANGSGTFTSANTELSWNYQSDGLLDIDLVDVQVFAIEMVYVPQGIFAAGDGASGNSQFTLTTINISNPLLGPSGSGSLGGQGGGYPTGQLAPSTATWPNGFNAFYAMKYEISQQGYVDFLNTLNRTQQATRVAASIAGLSNITNWYVMANNNAINLSSRNGIRCASVVAPSPAIRFFCDFNSNGIGGEPGDGKELACNYLGWPDVAAYLAWAGLRPGTELEFEKCGRGNQVPVNGEFAWGSRFIAPVTKLLDAGLPTEYSTDEANAVYGQQLVGPMRTGAFAKLNSGRESAGAGYYGNMELTGNLWERYITIGTAAGRNFAGSHGQGELDANGNFFGLADWPASDGLGGRGGSYVSLETDVMLSSRGQATTVTGRLATYGGRGVRTAP
jgi:formylglycine-generating enzyme required for sulfatase activity